MNRVLYLLAFVAGLAVVAWVGAGYLALSPLALAFTALIAVVYVVGALELYRYQQATHTLSRALANLPGAFSNDPSASAAAAPDAAASADFSQDISASEADGTDALEAERSSLKTPPSLADWLAKLDPSLRTAVRARVEGERVGLPGPALTPYLVGLLVLLGMLGTFLGMVATLRGTGLALENATDLQAIRASLAAPITGLGFAFGTSVAGVATSAMLGLLAALCRRDRARAVRRLDTEAAGPLRIYSQAHQREESMLLLQQQSQALPQVVESLQSIMAAMQQQSQALNEKLVAGQEQFYSKSEARQAALERQNQALIERFIASQEAQDAKSQAALAAVEQHTLALSTRIESDQQALQARVESDQHALQARNEATYAALEQHSQALTERLAAGQEAFHTKTEAAYTKLISSIETVHSKLIESSEAMQAHVAASAEAAQASLAATAQAATSDVATAAQTATADITSAAQVASSEMSSAANTVKTEVTEAAQAAHSNIAEAARAAHAEMASAATAARSDMATAAQTAHSEIAAAAKAASSDIATAAQSAHANMASSAEATYAKLAASVEESLKNSLEQAANAAGVAIQPVVQETLAGLARENTGLQAAVQASVQQHLDALSKQYDASTEKMAILLTESLVSQDTQRLAAWAQALQGIANALQEQWQNTSGALSTQWETTAIKLSEQWQSTTETLRTQWQHSADTSTEKQKEICSTLVRTAEDVATQTREHAAGTIAEIERLITAASEAPKAAAEVVVQVRDKLSESMERDNAMLEERGRMLETVGTLLDAINHASTEQRTAVNALLTNSSDLLDRIGTQVADKVEAQAGGLAEQAGKLADMASQVSGGATQIATLGDTFSQAVQSFGESNALMMQHLQRIEETLEKSIARSDEQLAYYVAQAREVIDLSLLSQKQILEQLQLAAGADTASSSSAKRVAAKPGKDETVTGDDAAASAKPGNKK